ncbi:lysine biosynthesis protein LysW [Patescibacteria group bacterium AH-259-L07]|nr:lysine biosynthesis protein LysW [Patescibacteria group bacterium AH-259-L07]
MSTLQLSCPECDASLNVSNDVEEGGIFSCSDCAEELEVRARSPLRLERAPQEEEDWGE